MLKKGFTLIELLVVIAVIAILATLVTTAAGYVIKNSRVKKVNITCETLKIAINRYKAEYNKWPGFSEIGSKTYSGKDNADVFGPLRQNSKDNPNGIRFIDETTVFTPGTGEALIPLSEADAGNKPLAYVPKSGDVVNKKGNFFYYKVEFDGEAGTVHVYAPALDYREEY